MAWRDSVMKNHRAKVDALIPNPTTFEPAMARDRRSRKFISGAWAHTSSLATKTPSNSRPPPTHASTTDDDHPNALVRTRPYVTATRRDVTSTAPTRSGGGRSVPGGLASDCDAGTKTREPMRAMTPTGTLMKRIHRHDSWSTRRPPSTAPMPPPATDTAPQMPIARDRSRPSGKLVVSTARVAGDKMAAP